MLHWYRNLKNLLNLGELYENKSGKDIGQLERTEMVGLGQVSVKEDCPQWLAH